MGKKLEKWREMEKNKEKKREMYGENKEKFLTI